MAEGLVLLFVGMGALALFAAALAVGYNRGVDVERGRWNEKTLKSIRRKRDG